MLVWLGVRTISLKVSAIASLIPPISYIYTNMARHEQNHCNT